MRHFRRPPALDRLSGAELYVLEGGRSAQIDAYTAAVLCGHPSVYRPESTPGRDLARGLHLVVVSPPLVSPPLARPEFATPEISGASA